MRETCSRTPVQSEPLVHIWDQVKISSNSHTCYEGGHLRLRRGIADETFVAFELFYSERASLTRGISSVERAQFCTTRLCNICETPVGDLWALCGKHIEPPWTVSSG